MKKGIGIGLLISAWLACTPAWADGIDSVGLLRTDYVGVGGIDMPKFVQRRIYVYLMDLFVTNKGFKQALSEIRAAGVSPEKILKRIVVGIPTDVERSEHIVLWETNEDLSQYKPMIAAHSDAIDTRKHNGMEYYATKRENECLAILDNLIVLGSELRVKEVLAAYKEGYREGPTNAGIRAELQRVNRQADAWFVWGLSAKESDKIGRADPILDKSSEGIGMLKLGDIKHGNLSMDFVAGLNAKACVGMKDDASAKQASDVMNAFLAEMAKDVDVVELGFDQFLSGIKFDKDKADVKLSVNYDQSKFDALVALVTQIAKSVPGNMQGSGQGAGVK
ncbi:MAG: hypothetical protein IJ268_09885 [Proteobacteria bacterium]|nr:hypothetical protein [Pseudomonadota bacterium]MBQ9244337.1 hypothetical protein [Pseudomonadota bacterium]